MQSKISFSLDAWTDIPKISVLSYLYAIARNYPNPLMVLLQSAIEKKTGIKLPSHEIATIVHSVDWSFLKKYPLDPIYDKIKVGFFTYYCSQGSFRLSSAKEFYYINKYYEEHIKGNQESLYLLAAVLYRKKNNKSQNEDNREEILTESQLNKQSQKFKRLPTPFFIALIMYVQAGMEHFEDIYKKKMRLGGGPPQKINLGWEATFMQVAETGVFGNLENVYKTNIHKIMLFLVSKKLEADDIKNSGKTSLI